MSSASPKCIVYQSPTRATITQPSVILYGSIEANVSTSERWQTKLTNHVAHFPIAVLNPLREDWDSTWKEDITCPKFKEQVEWEMDHAQVADVIMFYFAPGTLTPISLLELGMYAGTGKVVVCCPPGFYKRGNVQMVCLRYGIDLIDTMEEVSEEVAKRLTRRLEAERSSK